MDIYNLFFERNMQKIIRYVIIVLEYHGQAGMDSGNADFDSGMFANIFFLYLEIRFFLKLFLDLYLM